MAHAKLLSFRAQRGISPCRTSNGHGEIPRLAALARNDNASLRAGNFWLTTVLLAGAAALLLAVAAPALAWGDKGHVLITEEAVQRLPEPLRGLFQDGGNLPVLKEKSLAPDRRVKALEEELKEGKIQQPAYQAERSKHFFDIDAITTEPYPFKDFPRDRAAAREKFGAEAFMKFGSVPWVAADASAALTEALTKGRPDAIFDAAGDLSHFAADLHQPFHVAKNYNGRDTGNDNIHGRLEIGLLNRYLDFYAAEIRKDRRDVVYIEDVQGSLFDWLIEAHSRAATILDADTAARKRTGYVSPQSRDEADKELDDVASERLKPYYAAFKAELESRGSPEVLALRDSAAHIAQLYYSAWVRAGKPLSLTPPPVVAEKQPEPPGIPLWLIGVAMALLFFLFLPRRTPKV
jgi:hypothetical protein